MDCTASTPPPFRVEAAYFIGIALSMTTYSPLCIGEVMSPLGARMKLPQIGGDGLGGNSVASKGASVVPTSCLREEGIGDSKKCPIGEVR